jgi:Domain of unknown function (DUF1963)
LGISNRSIVKELLATYPDRSSADQLIVEQSRKTLLKELGPEDFLELETVLASKIDSANTIHWGVVETIMCDLLVYTDFNLDALILRLMKVQGHVEFPLLRGSGAASKKELYKQLESCPTFGLLGLAWIGDEEIVSSFAEWRSNPPYWATELSEPAHTYSYEGGWELSPDGKKRLLFSKKCFGFESSQSSRLTAVSQDPQTTSALCKLCGRLLYRITNISSHYLEMLYSIAPLAPNLEIPFCDLCTGASPGEHCEILANGVGQLSASALRRDDIPEWFFTATSEGSNLTLEIDGQTRDPFFAAVPFRKKNSSQIGGFPTWLQDAKYPKCQKCGRTMIFFLQLDSDDLPNLYPGMFYYFICDLCPNQFAVSKQFT